MYLKKLEIFGFKSFANKTVFTFAQGITAIVGPNGCGKTNVVDAIRWALGEQKTTVLRSEVMENVIFNGAGNKKPLGMAEVSIELENNKMILPVEYSEVLVTRRLYRDGDSRYFLNKTQCRLKDITNLFLDTGMGADSYSVIELKMVEAILSGKAEERRRLIEEAAGINKYKVRRKEAVRKLAYVQNDLVRVQDIVSEVEKQVRSLQRSSAKTKRFNKLKYELTQLEKSLIAYNYLTYNKSLTELEEKLKELISSKTAESQKMTDAENYLRKLEEDYHRLDAEFIDAQEQESKIKEDIAALNKNFAVSNEKIIKNEENVERFRAEIIELNGNIENLKNEFDKTVKKIEDINEQLKSNSEELGKHKAELERLDGNVGKIRQELNDKNEEIINKRNKIEAIENSHTKSEGRKQFLTAQIEEYRSEIDNLQKEINDVTLKIEETKKTYDKLNKDIVVKNKQLDEYRAKRDELNDKIEKKKRDLADLRVAIAKKNSEYDFLANIEIGDDATKKLIKSKKWKTASPKQLLIELINVNEDYQAAIESALGQYANVLVVDRWEETLQAIEILNNENLGKAGFISRDKIPEISSPKMKLSDKDVIGLVSEIVDVESEIRNVLRLLLPDYVLVKNLDVAQRLALEYSQYHFVTPKGEILYAGGFIRGGSLSKKEGIFVGKTKRLKVIGKELKKLNDKLSDNEKELEALQQELIKYNTEHLQNEIKKLENDLFYSEKTVSQYNFEVENLKSKIANIESNISNFEKELKEIGLEKSSSATELANMKQELTANKSELIEINKSLTLAQEKANEKRVVVQDIELQIARLKTQLDNENREKLRIRDEIDNTKKKIESLESEIKNSLAQIENLKLNKGNLGSEITKLITQSETAQTKREYLQQQKQELEQQIKQHEETLARLRKSYESLTENIHQVELKLNELKLKLETVIEHNNNLEDEKLDLATATVPEDFQPDETKVAIQELNAKLQSLGNINFMALEEYEAEKERMEFYHKQVKDLTDSEKTLQDTINEINETAERLFLDTFEAIREHFKTLFKKLFSEEAEADIKLTGDNILECDVEIIAKPPGKRPNSIDLLSGGEKTLTSIAFLFAIYLVKPSPFCILDEVDAPLDDANIDKFLNMIRDFSKNIQFLIVTHNKRTMEAADTMYGITQQNEGISKIVSVKMKN